MPGSTPPDDKSLNWLLAGLSREEYERLLPDLEPVALSLGEVLYRPQEPVSHIYFPDNGCVVSLLASMADGAITEVGAVGSEGMVGVCVFWGVRTTPYGARVQIPGGAMRMRADALRGVLGEVRPLHGILLRYTHALMVQVAQTAACNRFHTLEQRLARWLLVCHDRARSDGFPLTQEFIAEILGVRRPGVTETAAGLRARKLIAYSRGHITVTDRRGLEELSCECYRVVREELQQYLTAVVPAPHLRAALSAQRFEELGGRYVN
jgi:CRP-like cAMP-binding protein